MKNSIKNSKETFLLTIESQQNATWQGTVTWVEKRDKQYFRSALELIKLIESALEEQNKEGEGQ
nr:hypothetical protein [uncultured Sellimonas sp.]